MTALSKVERLEFVEMIFARLFIVVCFLMFFVTGCAVDGVDGGEPVPKFVLSDIFSHSLRLIRDGLMSTIIG